MSLQKLPGGTRGTRQPPAHPYQVRAEVGGKSQRVDVVQLEGEARDRAWAAVVASSPRFGGYEQKTDRVLPVLRLTPVD